MMLDPVVRWGTIPVSSFPAEILAVPQASTLWTGSTRRDLASLVAIEERQHRLQWSPKVIQWLIENSARSLSSACAPGTQLRVADSRDKVRCLGQNAREQRFFDAYASALTDIFDQNVSDALMRWQMDLSAIVSVAERILGIADALTSGGTISLLDEARLLLRYEKLRTRRLSTDRFGWDGAAPQKLEQIGLVNHITRERVRQIVRPVELRFQSSRPALPLLVAMIRTVNAAGRPLSIEALRRRIPDSVIVSNFDIQAAVDMREWKWHDLKPVEYARKRFVVPENMGDVEALDLLTSASHTYRKCRNVGVLPLLRDVTGLDAVPVRVRSLLRTFGQIDRLGRGWLGTSHSDAFLARRVFQLLSVLGPLSVRELYRGLRKERQKWKTLRTPFPPPEVLVAYLYVIGCRVEDDLVVPPRGVVHAELSGAEKCVVDALRASPVPLTSLELTARARALGATEAMTLFQISQSPFVETLRRGIFALRGNTPSDSVLVAAAKRRTFEPSSTVSGRVERTEPGIYHAEFLIHSRRMPHNFYIPSGQLPLGRFRWSDDAGEVVVRRTYIAGLGTRYRQVAEAGAASLRLVFNRLTRIVSVDRAVASGDESGIELSS